MNPEQILQTYLDKVSERAPSLRAIMDRAKAGEIDEQTAMQAMLQEIGDNPDLKRDLEALAAEFMLPVPTAPAKALWAPSGDLPEVMFRGAAGLPGLNPLYEAALAERAQFDGDIPELRFGPLADGVAPAVSVKTKARQPVALGQMLKTASEQVRTDVDAHEAQRLKTIEAVAEGQGGQVLGLMAKHGELVAQAGRDLALDVERYGSAETDHPSYRRGQVPAPVQVPTPTGSALMALTPQERRERAWKFLSTTQGRRTAVDAIRELAAKSLRTAGLTVTERDFDPKRQGEPLASHEWSFMLSGPGATQDSFSVIDVAARALGKGLERKLVGLTVRQVYLEVIPLNTIDERTVGWAARVLE